MPPYTLRAKLKSRIIKFLYWLAPNRWCWASLVFWALDDWAPGAITWEDVEPAKQCGYCGACM